MAEAAALTATANKIIQDADSVGTALKTTSLRLRGTDVSVLEEEGLDSDGAVTSKSKLRSKVQALSGIDILTQTGEYKSTYEILSQIADVWESINNMDQAALLELISGKRNASVIAAILQNPEELKAAFEDANNASGSALKENEKYLDSIQGKIDQFNNAVQSLWSNLLDSDVVKGVVEFFTDIVKSLNTTQGKILGIVKAVALLMVYKKVNPLDWITKFGNISNAIEKDGLKSYIMSLFQVSAAQKTVTADTLVGTIAQEQNNVATQQQIISKLGLTNVTGALTAAQKLQAAQELVTLYNGHMISRDLATRMAAMLGYKFSVDATNGATVTLDTTTKSFMASNPVGWILLIVSAIISLVMWISSLNSKVENLREDMSSLKSEISDTKSEIDSLNTELETTRERMAELIAMPSLSFVEQEELANLRTRTAELEKQLSLQKTLQEMAEKQLAHKTEDYIKAVWDGDSFFDKAYVVDYYTGEISDDTWYQTGIDTKDALAYAKLKYREHDELLKSSREALSNWDNLSWADQRTWYAQVTRESGQTFGNNYAFADKEDFEQAIRDLEVQMDTTKSSIYSVYGDEAFADLTYGMSDEIDNFLSEYQADYIQSKILLGDFTNLDGVNEILKTGGNDVQKLQDDIANVMNGSLDDDAKKQRVSQLIADATKDNSQLAKSLEGVFGSLENGTKILNAYYTQIGQTPDSSTIEGITAQYNKGVEALQKYQEAKTQTEGVYGPQPDIVVGQWKDILTGELEDITWSSLFDPKTGETVDEQISKLLQGADETTRKEFSRIAKAVNEGSMSVDAAMKSFSISGVQGGYKLLEDAIVDINSDIFKDLGDEITGLIDTFDEFGTALESVAKSIDLVTQAEAEMAYSGHLSVETALELINSTEDWNKVLKIENGNITLVDGAMDILAQSKLNQIKTNLQLALSEAKAGLEQARLAENSGEVAKTLEESTTESVRQLAANMEYLSTLIGEFLNGNFLGAGSEAARAKQKSLDATTYQKTSTASSMSVADWEEKVSDIEAKLGMLESVDTTEEFKSNYYSDEVSGGNATKEDVANDAFQREMDYWENRIAANQAKYEQLQSEIDLLDKKGQKADTSYYEEQIKLEGQRLELLNGQKKAAKTYLSTLEEGSEKWF